jgi:hypothetical protein
MRVNLKTDEVRLDEAPDFDEAREPHPGRMFHCPLNARGHASSDALWHHKWLWVMDDYPGFDAVESRRWAAP